MTEDHHSVVMFYKYTNDALLTNKLTDTSDSMSSSIPDAVKGGNEKLIN